MLTRILARSSVIPARVASASIVVWSSALLAQQSSTHLVSGVVTDSVGTHISYAKITGGLRPIMAGAEGEFKVNVLGGKSTILLVRRIGFHPYEIRVDGSADTSLTVTMAPVAQRLEAIQVAAQVSQKLAATGFYERMLDSERRGSIGRFITPEDIESRGFPKITRLFEDVRDVVVVQGPMALGGIPLEKRLSGCVMATYINGVRTYLFPAEAPGKTMSTLNRMQNPTMREKYDPSKHMGLDNFIQSNEVLGIEVYPGVSSAPMRFQAENCGVILIWTK